LATALEPPSAVGIEPPPAAASEPSLAVDYRPSSVNRGDIVRPWSHGAGSECSVLIYYSHNSHSLSNYSVDVALEVVDHGHMRLGYELSTRSTVLTTSPHSTCTTEAVRKFPIAVSFVMVNGHPVQCTGILYC